MMCRPVFVWVCLVSVLLGTSTASVSQEVLSLDQAIEEARTGNPDLQAERLRLNIARSRRTLAGLLVPFNPEFEFEGVSDRLLDDQGNRGYSLSLSQEIEIAGQRGRRIGIANLALEQARAEIARFERVLITEIKTSYHSLGLSREKLKVADAIIALNDRLATAAERRFRTGDISELEFNLVSAERDQAAAERYRLEADTRGAEAELNLLLARPADRATLVRADTTHTSANFDLGQLVQSGLEMRRDLKAMRLEEEAAEKGIGLAIAEGLPNPKVSLVFDKERSVVEGDDFIGDPAIIGGIEGIRDRDRVFRVQIALPLPFMNRNQAGVQAARAQSSIAKRRLEGLGQRVRVEVTGAYERFIGANRALEAYRMLLPGVQQNAELLITAYEAGELDLTAMLVQTDRIFRMRLAYFDALLADRQALAELELAVGGPPPTRMP